MPPPEPHEVLASIERLIASLMRTRPDLNQDIATLAEWIARVARASADAAPAPAAAPPSSAQPTASPSEPAAPQVIVRAPTTIGSPSIIFDPRTVQKTAIVPLRIGDSHIHLPVSGSTVEIGHARQSAGVFDTTPDYSEYEHATIEIDLNMIARRCAIKARSCDVVLERNAQVAGSAEEASLVSEINTLITQAKALPLCFVWAPFKQAPLPPEDIVRTAARAYENVGLLAALMDRLRTEPGLGRHHRDALELFAEAQSALRVILERTWLTRPDQDQLDSYIWISRFTKAEHIYVGRFLRLDDPGDPADHARLHADIAALTARVESAAKKSKGATAALNKLKYHVAHLGTPPEESELVGLRHAADILASQEIEPDDKRVREIVRPLEALLAAGAEIGDYLAAAVGAASHHASTTAESPPEPRAYSAQVERVRSMLAGSVVMLAGGEVYGHARDRLIEAFDLADLEWCSQTEHGSSAVFESPIARPETRLVLVLVKLAGHQHIEDIRRWCRAYTKPMVMLTAGYNPEQVAAAVLEQADGRLGG